MKVKGCFLFLPLSTLNCNTDNQQHFHVTHHKTTGMCSTPALFAALWQVTTRTVATPATQVRQGEINANK